MFAHFILQTFQPTPSFSKWTESTQHSRAKLTDDDFFDYLERAWDRTDLSQLLAALEQGILKKAITWGLWIDSVEGKE